MPLYKHRHSNKARRSQYLTPSMVFSNLQTTPMVQRSITRQITSNHPLNKEALAATPSDNQAGSPPTFAIALGA